MGWRVDGVLTIAALAVMPLVVAAQPAAPQPHGPAKTSPHAARAARPMEIPLQYAPPQEAFASMPDKERGAAQAAGISACDQALSKLAVLRPLGVLIAPGECGAADAVLLESVLLADGSSVAVTPPATLRCTAAQAVADWIRDDVAPQTAKLGAALRAVENLGSYECRGRDRVRGATLSEHGRADALDVRAVRLANGRTLVLADPKAPKEWREAMRASACNRFSTVLGPGSDAEHAEHVHVDLAERHRNYRLCEWDVREPAPTEAEAAIAVDEVPLPRPRPAAADLAGDLAPRPGRAGYR